MASRVSTVIRCGALTRWLLPAIDAVERQRGGRGAIIIVTDASTPTRAQEWVAALSAARGYLHAHALGATPGAIRNTGIRLSPDPLVSCLDAGDLIADTWQAECAARIDDTSAAFVTTGMLMIGPGETQRPLPPAGADMNALLGAPDAAQAASVFRRSAWDAIGGHDESLDALDHCDFLLRLLAAGHRGDVIQTPLYVRPARKDGLYRLDWREDARAQAIVAMTGRAAASLDPATVLCERERSLRAAGLEYREALSVRDRGTESLAALEAERQRLQSQVRPRAIDLGDLNRTSPVSRDWGYERGGPVDRHYIEAFLQQQAADIAGAVLEVQEPDYTQRFGGGRVTRSDVLDLDPANPLATVVADLRCAPNVPDETYDCIILTQTLHVIDDMRAVVAECARILKPGGVLLATLPCASRVCLEYGHDGDFWRVTEAAARRLFGSAFPASHLTVQSHGNVLVTSAFLYGLGAPELSGEAYTAADPYLPTLVSVRAQKPGGLSAILLYHRVAESVDDVHHLAIAPADFREQMRHLAAHYRVVPLEVLAEELAHGEPAPGTIAVTFDDGYADNLEEASPILLEFGLPATFFVTTDRLSESAAYRYWWDVLESALLTPSGAWCDELRVELPDGVRQWSTVSAADRRAAHDAIYHAVVGLPANQRDDVIEAIRRWRGSAEPDLLARRVTSAEVRELASRPGHTIGAHSVRHLVLPRQPAEVQAGEVAESRRALEAVIDRPVTAFAYPFGAWDAASRSAVAAAGFRIALACGDGAIPRRPDVLSLPRLDVAARGPEDFGSWLSRHIWRVPAVR